MSQNHEGEWAISLDERDPLHTEILRYLRAIRKRGRYSPVRRILTRWACNGYLLELGRLPASGASDPNLLFEALAASGLLAHDATPETLAEALAEMLVVPQQPTRPARTRLDIAEAQREIAAITAAAEQIDFE